jgi:SAM-dependent methyltransferase
VGAVTRPDRPLARTHSGRIDLRRAWDENAPGFIAWAREPDHDSYWRFHRDLFLELVPPPGRRTLDLGCGEGRLSRDLRKLGHEVAGVDASPTMVAAAQQAAPEIDVLLADAAALPFGDGSFDCVVAFMSLQDVDDFEGAIAEGARVLQPGGRLCLAIVHPLNSAGRFEGEQIDSPFVVRGSYLDRSYYSDNVVRDGLEVTFASEHRPLDAYTEALASAGFVIERLREPPLPEHGLTSAHSRRWQRVPLFLHIRALKPR